MFVGYALYLTGHSMVPEGSSIRNKRIAMSEVYGVPGALKMAVTHRNFEGKEDNAVRDFLSAHQAIREIMPRLRTEVSKVFGPMSTITLEVQRDHAEEYDSLVANVLFNGAATDALAKFDELGAGWWFDVCGKFDGELVVDVDVV